MATDSNSDDSDFSLEMARQFAREKRLPLITCNIDDKVKVQEVFQSLVERVMGSIETGGVEGDGNMSDEYPAHA